jgi:hypothetical protein
MESCLKLEIRGRMGLKLEDYCPMQNPGAKILLNLQLYHTAYLFSILLITTLVGTVPLSYAMFSAAR